MNREDRALQAVLAMGDVYDASGRLGLSYKHGRFVATWGTQTATGATMVEAMESLTGKLAVMYQARSPRVAEPEAPWTNE